MRMIYCLQFDLTDPRSGPPTQLIVWLGPDGDSPDGWTFPRGDKGRVCELQAGDWLYHRRRRLQILGVRP